MSEIKKILLISRPRFWIYELGTFFIGYLLAAKNMTDFYNLDFILFFIYFTFPANLLIYGINDIFDYGTDKLNPKKLEYEVLLQPKYHKKIFYLIIFFNIPFLIYSVFRLNTLQIFLFSLFLFFAIFYSAKPIRAKTKPFIDSFFSAGHYVFTGIFSYYLIYPNKPFPIWIIIFGFLWAIAMHAYSAVPDIEADQKANINTIATFLGDKKTIYFCLLLYSIAFVILSKFSFIYLVGAIPYLFLMILSLKNLNNKEKIFKIYKIFPYINTFLPMIWCLYYIYLKFFLRSYKIFL